MTTSSYESLSHAKWDGKSHVVFVPQGRKKALDGKLRCFLGLVLRALAGPRGSTILAGPMVQAHVHRLIRMPPRLGTRRVAWHAKRQESRRRPPADTPVQTRPAWLGRFLRWDVHCAPHPRLHLKPRAGSGECASGFPHHDHGVGHLACIPTIKTRDSGC